MIDLTPLPDTNSDRIKLPFSFDVEKMREEVTALQLKEYEYYNVIPLRAPAYQVDASIPEPPPAEDYADGSWTDWLDTPQLNQSPYLQTVIETFSKHTTVNLVRILRLAPDSVVKEHTDPTLGIQVPKSMIRLTIPIWSGDDVEFYLNDEEVEMEEGECWYCNFDVMHEVYNKSDESRIHLILDCIVNDWLKEVFSNARSA